MLTAIMLSLALFLGACKPTADARTDQDIAGTYTLITIDGKTMPADVSHDGHLLQVHSGSLAISADGTCSSKTVFVPPGGAETTREVSATYTRTGSRLDIQWKGAGKTTGNLEATTFTMSNEGMVLVYRR